MSRSEASVTHAPAHSWEAVLYFIMASPPTAMYPSVDKSHAYKSHNALVPNHSIVQSKT